MNIVDNKGNNQGQDLGVLMKSLNKNGINLFKIDVEKTKN